MKYITYRTNRLIKQKREFYLNNLSNIIFRINNLLVFQTIFCENWPKSK